MYAFIFGQTTSAVEQKYPFILAIAEKPWVPNPCCTLEYEELYGKVIGPRRLRNLGKRTKELIKNI